MKTNQFSICNQCIYFKSCVLTDQKEKVWSCSEYEDEPIKKEKLSLHETNISKEKPRMAISYNKSIKR